MKDLPEPENWGLTFVDDGGEQRSIGFEWAGLHPGSDAPFLTITPESGRAPISLTFDQLYRMFEEATT